jgi:hypothetical protein
MAKGDIKLSPKYGVNPSVGVCFWCGGKTGEVILNGRTPGDQEAPKYVCRGYEPCSNCKKEFEKYLTVVELSDNPQGEYQPSITATASDGTKVTGYPTGRKLQFQYTEETPWERGKPVLIDTEGFEMFLAEREKHLNGKESNEL